MDCLRYWVMEMHVDGFRFDLASIMTRAHSVWEQPRDHSATVAEKLDSPTPVAGGRAAANGAGPAGNGAAVPPLESDSGGPFLDTA